MNEFKNITHTGCESVTFYSLSWLTPSECDRWIYGGYLKCLIAEKESVSI